DTDDLAQEAGGDMVRRAAEKSAAEFGPFAHRSAPLDQLLIIARHQPATVDPCVTVAAGALGREGQALQIFRSRLKIVQRGRGPHRVEEGGVRCNYHGWLYDADGSCLAQPYEDTAHPEARLKDQIRIKAYPVEELGGLLWAYLGPEPRPLVPDWEFFSWKNGFRQIVL